MYNYKKLADSDDDDAILGNVSNKLGEKWTMMQTDGQKHAERIRKLNNVKKNEAFEERYEETREDREERITEADKKRQMIVKLSKQSPAPAAKKAQAAEKTGNLLERSKKLTQLKKEEEEYAAMQLREQKKRQQWQLYIMGQAPCPHKHNEQEAESQNDEAPDDEEFDEEADRRLQQKMIMNLNRFVYSSGEDEDDYFDEYENTNHDSNDNDDQENTNCAYSRQMRSYAATADVADAKAKDLDAR